MIKWFEVEDGKWSNCMLHSMKHYCGDDVSDYHEMMCFHRRSDARKIRYYHLQSLLMTTALCVDNVWGPSSSWWFMCINHQPLHETFNEMDHWANVRTELLRHIIEHSWFAYRGWNLDAIHRHASLLHVAPSYVSWCQCSEYSMKERCNSMWSNAIVCIKMKDHYGCLNTL